MEKLAIFGGTPVIQEPLPHYKSIGQNEVEAVVKVTESGLLSGFYGSYRKEFFGGPYVRTFEEAWSKKFRVKHAVSVNSATSGLYAAMGAIGINPGDEVIVPPYTMSATVVAPLIYGGIPVFVDIEPDTFCLDTEKVIKAISPKTKAIIAVNLFGHPADLHRLKNIARQNNIFLIEDNAQAILATENEKFAGTIGDIGIFSLNFHKHIHTGEGGVCVTDDDDLALRLQMIRNHAESIAEPASIENLTNLVGFNFRLSELSAAIGIEQLNKVEKHVQIRRHLAQQLSKGIENLDGIVTPIERNDCTHSYYTWCIRYDEEIVGATREQFSKALTAEGFPHGVGYVRPLYLLPMFQKKIAIGNQGFPFNLGTPNYNKGICPIVEKMHEKQLMLYEICLYDIDQTKLQLLIEAFHKVYTHRKEVSTILIRDTSI